MGEVIVVTSGKGGVGKTTTTANLGTGFALMGKKVVFALIIQATVLPLITIDGVRPDLLLVAVVSFSLLRGKEQGVGLGFFTGLLQDLASGNIFGLNVLSKMAMGYLAGFMERRVFKENVLLPVLAVVVATIFNGIITFLLLLVLGYGLNSPGSLLNGFYLLVYNALLAIPVHRLIYRLKSLDDRYCG